MCHGGGSRTSAITLVRGMGGSIAAEIDPRSASNFPPGAESLKHSTITDLLSVTVLQYDHAVVVAHVVGEVDMLTGPSLESHLHNALATRPKRLIVDLSQVSFLASTGLAVLIDAHTTATRQGTILQLKGVSKAAALPLQVTELINLFEILPAKEGRPDG
jgi:anti-sigma B factor antagonist